MYTIKFKILFKRLPGNAIFFLLLIFTTYNASGQCENIYQRLWGLNNGTDINVSSSAYIANNDLLICGSLGTGAFVIKCKQTDTISWSKSYQVGVGTEFTKVIAHSDGGIVAAGYTTEATNKPLCVVKLDGNGNVIWTERLLDKSSVAGLTLRYSLLEGIAEAPNGAIVLCGRKLYLRPDGSSCYSMFVFMLNEDGSLAWSREDNNGSNDECFGILVEQGSIFIVGSSYLISAATTYGFIEKLNPVNGAVQFLKFYKLSDIPNNYFRSIEKTRNGFEIGTQAFNATGNKLYYNLKVDYQGNVTELKKLQELDGGTSFAAPYHHPVPLPNGGTALWGNFSGDAALKVIESDRINSWLYQYTLPGIQTISKVMANPDNTTLIVGNSPDPAFPAGPKQIFLSRVKQDGTAGNCIVLIRHFAIKDSLNYAIVNGSWQTSQLSFEAPLNATAVTADLPMFEKTLCNDSDCIIDTMRIAGDTNICKPQATIVYKARFVGSCRAPVIWKLAPAIGNVTQLNDSMIVVKFTTAGNAILSADANSTCFKMNTAINISYNPSALTVDLGKDITICKGDTVQLFVNNSFQHILWSNGASVNNIRVFSPGNYYVAASDDSICFIRDTIEIIEHYFPPVKLGNDSVLCQPGALILNAGAGYNSYEWQNGSTAATFSVTGTGKYWVKVTGAGNCTAVSDTVDIKKISAKPFNFASFPDTSLCGDKEIVLTLSAPFKNYSWNNGIATTPAYTATTTGLYTVKVTTNEGCPGSDSIIVHTLNCTKKVYLPNAFTPNNDGRNDFLKPTFFAATDFFELYVYNIYGQLIFQSNKVEKGWDGTFGNAPQTQGTYTWMIRYRFTGNANIEKLAGSIILLR